MALEIQNLSKSYPAPVGPDTQVLDVPAFEMDTGSVRFTESGSETTFLHLVAGILRPDRGTILLEGQDLTQLRVQSGSSPCLLYWLCFSDIQSSPRVHMS